MVDLDPDPLSESSLVAARRPRHGRLRRRRPGRGRIRWIAGGFTALLLSGCGGSGSAGSTPGSTPELTPELTSPTAAIDRGDQSPTWFPIAVPGESEAAATSQDVVPDSIGTMAIAGPAETSVPAPTAGGWQLNGSAQLVGDDLLLTDSEGRAQAGSAFWPDVITAAGTVTASFDVRIAGGTGADGIAFAVVDADLADARVLGTAGGGLGWAGAPGFAIAIDTFQNVGDPSFSSVGLVTGFDPAAPDQLRWADAATSLPRLRGDSRHVDVVIRDGLLTVSIDTVVAFAAPIALPHRSLLGFTGANGGRTDRHLVSNISLAVS